MSHIPGLDLEAGTPVLLATKHSREGTLIDGGSPDADGRYDVEYYTRNFLGREQLQKKCIPIAELALPLMNWPTKKFFSRASTSGGEVNLYLPAGIKVVVGTSKNTRGSLVVGGPPISDNGYLVAYENRQGAAEEEYHDIGELAVPLDSWWTPPSWPILPAGTTMVILSEITVRRPLLTTMEGPPSARGFCYVVRADGKNWQVALNRLVEPVTSWWVEPSNFEVEHQTYAQLPADTRVAVGSADDVKGTLVNGPTADGTYKIRLSKFSNKVFDVHGTELAVPLETRLHLHQMVGLQQDIISLRTRVGEQDAYISELKRKEMTSAAALTKQKSECERANECMSNLDQSAKQAIFSLKTKVGEQDAYISELKRKEMTTAAALTKQKSECKRAQERISKIVLGERLMLSSAGEHDYGSNLPSPADLVQRIASIQDQLFVDWVAEALGDPGNTWWVSQYAIEAIENPRNFVLQVLVETARECFRRVHECISRQMDQMTSIMGEFVGAANDSCLAEEVAHFKRSAFHKGYKAMFAEVCPTCPIDQSELARAVFHGLAACVSVSKISPNGPTALVSTTQAAYEDIVNTLLLTFLECEVQRSTPLKFSENFGSREAWNPSEHHKDTFDPSYEGDKLVEGNTQVQVVIPRLFWEKKMADDDSVSRFFETQASFVIPSA